YGIYKPQWNGFTPTPDTPDSITLYFGKIRLGAPGATLEDVACDTLYRKNNIPLEINIDADKIIHSLNNLPISNNADEPLSDIVGRLKSTGEFGILSQTESAKAMLQRGVLANNSDLNTQIQIGTWVLPASNTYPN